MTRYASRAMHFCEVVDFDYLKRYILELPRDQVRSEVMPDALSILHDKYICDAETFMDIKLGIVSNPDIVDAVESSPYKLRGSHGFAISHKLYEQIGSWLYRDVKSGVVNEYDKIIFNQILRDSKEIRCAFYKEARQ